MVNRKININKKSDRTTLCISNGEQSVINKTNMNKINGSENMKTSANKPPQLIHLTVSDKKNYACF